MGNSVKASKLCSKELRFGKVLKIVEKYWKVGPGLIYINCAGVDYNCLGKYRDRTIQYVICASTYKVKNHRYEITKCTIKMGKICTHSIPECINCEGNHNVILFKCLAKLKV